MKDGIFNSPLLNVTLFSLFWAVQIFVSKLAFIAGANPTTFTIQSAFPMFLVMAITVYFFVGINKFRSLTKNIFWGLMLANAIHYAIGGFLGSVGIALTSAINAGFLVKFALVTTIFLAWLILRERLTISKLLAAAVMLMGSYLISTNGKVIVPHVGDLIIIGACFAWSTGNVLIRKTLKNNSVSPEIVSFLRPISGVPPLLLFVSLVSAFPSPVQTLFTVNLLDLTFSPYVFANGFFTALLSIFLNRTLNVASASYMTMMSNLTSVIVTIFALVFLRETMSIYQFIGGLLIISASVITHYLKVDKH